MPITQRTCILTREILPKSQMIRFVLSPSHVLVPDIKATLPGRGAWLKLNRSLLEAAIRKNVFLRSFKTQMEIMPDLPDLVDNLLKKAVLGALALARKSGGLVWGADKLENAIRLQKVRFVLHAKEAAADGKRKIAQAIYAVSDKNELKIATGEFFSAADLEAVFGSSPIMHIGVLNQANAKSVHKWLEKLVLYREKI